MDRIYRIAQGTGRHAVERDGQLFWLNGDIFDAYEAGEPVASAGPHRFLAPVTPSIVVCIGLNYKDHAAEMNKKLPAEPLVFLKPQSAVIAEGLNATNVPASVEAGGTAISLGASNTTPRDVTCPNRLGVATHNTGPVAAVADAIARTVSPPR